MEITDLNKKINELFAVNGGGRGEFIRATSYNGAIPGCSLTGLFQVAMPKEAQQQLAQYSCCSGYGTSQKVLDQLTDGCHVPMEVFVRAISHLSFLLVGLAVFEPGVDKLLMGAEELRDYLEKGRMVFQEISLKFLQMVSLYDPFSITVTLEEPRRTRLGSQCLIKVSGEVLRGELPALCLNDRAHEWIRTHPQTQAAIRRMVDAARP